MNSTENQYFPRKRLKKISRKKLNIFKQIPDNPEDLMENQSTISCDL